MKKAATCAIVTTLSLFFEKDVLTGSWETKPSVKGNTTGIVFRPDNSFEGYVNKKPFVTGTYTLHNSIFSFVDNGCEGKEGIYKILLSSNNDSLRLELISDSCVERREGMKRLILGRVR